MIKATAVRPTEFLPKEFAEVMTSISHAAKEEESLTLTHKEAETVAVSMLTLMEITSRMSDAFEKLAQEGKVEIEEQGSQIIH